MWFRKSKAEKKPSQDPTAVIRELRDAAFTRLPSEVGIHPSGTDRQVWCVIWEAGYPEATVTLFTAIDGSTSMYFSSGGAILGSGEHQSVRDATLRFIAAVEADLQRFAPTTDYAVPAVDRIRVYARTFETLLAAEANRDDLGNADHPLAAVLIAANDVISAVRILSEQQQRRPR